MGTVTSTFLPYAPLLATVVGWYLVNRQNNKREARKERRALIDGAKRQVLEISSKAVSYLQDSASRLAPDIKWSLDALEIELLRIPGYGDSSQLLEEFVAFTDACTGGKFEQVDREAEQHDSPAVQRVIKRRNWLLEALEAWFAKNYPT